MLLRQPFYLNVHKSNPQIVSAPCFLIYLTHNSLLGTEMLIKHPVALQYHLKLSFRTNILLISHVIKYHVQEPDTFMTVVLNTYIWPNNPNSSANKVKIIPIWSLLVVYPLKYIPWFTNIDLHVHVVCHTFKNDVILTTSFFCQMYLQHIRWKMTWIQLFSFLKDNPFLSCSVSLSLAQNNTMT